MVTLFRAIIVLIDLIEMLIVIRILFSFLNIRGKRELLTGIVYDLTEPVLGPIRNLIFNLGIKTGMFDFSPLVSILLLRVLSNFIRTRLM